MSETKHPATWIDIWVAAVLIAVWSAAFYAATTRRIDAICAAIPECATPTPTEETR